MVKICILLLLLAVTLNLYYENYATTIVQFGLFLPVQDWTRVASKISKNNKLLNLLFSLIPELLMKVEYKLISGPLKTVPGLTT